MYNNNSDFKRLPKEWCQHIANYVNTVNSDYDTKRAFEIEVNEPEIL